MKALLSIPTSTTDYADSTDQRNSSFGLKPLNPCIRVIRGLDF